MTQFQDTVRDDQATGIVGEIAFDGPCRARPYNLDSSGTPQTIGNAFTVVPGSSDDAAVGSAGGGAFAGILVHPKHYALEGTTAGTLEPTRVLPDNSIGELLTMGTIFVDLSIVGTGEIGEGIFYVDATGSLGSGVAAAGQTQIANAKIDRYFVAAPGLACITLTEGD